MLTGIFLMGMVTSLMALSIKDIQYTTDASGDSPYKGQVVTISGEVTGEPYAYGGKTFFIQDSVGMWSGLMVYYSSIPSADELLIAEGDWVTVTGTVTEYNGVTEISPVTSVTVDSTGTFAMKPIVVTTVEIGDGGANAEAYEGVLVCVKDVNITSTMTSYGEWNVSDGSGDVMVDDKAKFYFWPDEYDNCLSITGVMDYAYSHRRIYPRLAWDIVEGYKKGESTIYTRMQRIQQVRYSDLVKAAAGEGTDASYIANPDTIITIKGIITMPTGLSYAGAGIKFILSDIHGGPWSGIMSYNENAAIYPTLYEGDIIEMTGYVSEYVTGPSDMTEFFLVGDVTVLDFGQTLPDEPVMTTGDIRLPQTAEQYGTVMVQVLDAVVNKLGITYYMFGIDDGTGMALVGGDSDSMDTFVNPPLLTPIESISGWLYHHYGSYADSSAYNINPLYHEDIVLGSGPAMIMDEYRTPSGIVTSSDAVDVGATVVTGRNIVGAKLYYKVDNAATYTELNLTEGLDNVWSAQIPAQSNGAFVDYYYSVEDDSGDVSLLPSDPLSENFNYVVVDGDVSIRDIQYTHWNSGGSPFEGVTVTVSGTVTTPSDPMVNIFVSSGISALAIAEAAGPWHGIYLVGPTALLSDFVEGDILEVTGKVTDHYENSYWRWDLNTYIAVTGVLKQAHDTPIQPTVVTLQELEENSEAYEGVLVQVNDGHISAVNHYDFTLSDGTYGYLIDDDFVPDSVLTITSYTNAVVGAQDTLGVGGAFDMVKGVCIYSYGTAKIEVRNVDDMKVKETGISDRTPALPNAYALHQNYPNPFNPTTNIAFDLPVAGDVKVVIYNIQGQMVKTLLNDYMGAGHHVRFWDGTNSLNEKVSSGLYLYRIKAGDFTDIKKMTFVK